MRGDRSPIQHHELHIVRGEVFHQRRIYLRRHYGHGRSLVFHQLLACTLGDSRVAICPEEQDIKTVFSLVGVFLGLDHPWKKEVFDIRNEHAQRVASAACESLRLSVRREAQFAHSEEYTRLLFLGYGPDVVDFVRHRGLQYARSPSHIRHCGHAQALSPLRYSFSC